MEEALKDKDTDRSIIMGDLNVDLDKPKDLRGIEIVETIKSFQLKDLVKCFKARGKGKPRKMWAWRQIREGRRISARCDHILGGGQNTFQKLPISQD